MPTARPAGYLSKPAPNPPVQQAGRSRRQPPGRPAPRGTSVAAGGQGPVERGQARISVVDGVDVLDVVYAVDVGTALGSEVVLAAYAGGSVENGEVNQSTARAATVRAVGTAESAEGDVVGLVNAVTAAAVSSGMEAVVSTEADANAEIAGAEEDWNPGHAFVFVTMSADHGMNSPARPVRRWE